MVLSRVPRLNAAGLAQRASPTQAKLPIPVVELVRDTPTLQQAYQCTAGSPRMATDDSTEDSQKGRWFPVTHWTDIVAARRDGSATAVEALNRLCSTYWYPIYAYIRRKGHSEADAKDIAQGFFFHVLERNLLGAADRTKG